MRALLVALLLTAGLAGCLSDADDQRPLVEEPAPLPGVGVREEALSKDLHAILPARTAYLTASLDGVLLHARVFLPDGEGPWPTIVESSPYHTWQPAVLAGFEGVPGLVDRYVPKGYAVVLADVRGTGNSEGCMDMMGAREQQDQHDLVEWVAAQEWSDGHVGMQGVSYVGTTPHEAAITAPPHLDAVVTVAGVTNQWRNVYQGGVPYFGRWYPLTYEALEGAPPPADVERGPAWALNAASGACDQEEALGSVSPGTYEKGVYTPYWHERNLTARASEVVVPILYSQGFADRAVNPMEAVHWFNDIQAPKKAFLHQGGHQYPPRGDYFTVELAWFDQWLKGIDTGVLDTPVVEVQTNDDRIRADTTWPPVDAERLVLHPTADGALAATAAEGRLTYTALNALGSADVGFGDRVPRGALSSDQLAWSMPAGGLYLAGMPELHLRGGIDGPETADNTYWLFQLRDRAPDGTETFLAEGWFNAHLHAGLDRVSPLAPGTAYDFTVRFEPREYLFAEGHELVLVLRGHDYSVAMSDEPATQNFVLVGPDATRLVLPVLEAPVLHEVPASAR